MNAALQQLAADRRFSGMDRLYGLGASAAIR
ncbi:MAG: hypothetical protein RLZZ271_1097, partial [Pseudomonadota bacterium]